MDENEKILSGEHPEQGGATAEKKPGAMLKRGTSLMIRLKTLYVSEENIIVLGIWMSRNGLKNRATGMTKTF